MLEHFLIVWFVDALLALDRFAQRRLRSGVPRIDELWEDAQRVLNWQDITIRPRRSWAVATALGGLVGCLCPCGLFFYTIDRPDQQFRPLPWYTQVVLLGTALVGPASAILLISHWLRGGEMILRADGVLLRYRRDRVYCPWAVFSGPWRAVAAEQQILGRADLAGRRRGGLSQPRRNGRRHWSRGRDASAPRSAGRTGRAGRPVPGPPR
jgi:hypothetical protein